MPEYTDPDVADLRESERTTDVILLLGVSGDRETAIERIEQAGATVTAALGRTTVRVTAPESVVAALCLLDCVKSIEIERDGVQTRAEGNRPSRRRETR